MEAEAKAVGVGSSGEVKVRAIGFAIADGNRAYSV